MSLAASRPKPSLETGPAGVYIPSPWGNTYHHVTDNGVVIDEILGGGSAGPGKTVVLFRDPLFQMQREHQRCLLPRDHPHYIRWGESSGYALLLRRTTPMIEELWKMSFIIFPKWDPKAEPEARTMTWRFQSGYRYQFGHCNDVDDWMRYAGNAKTWIGYDELNQFEESQYENINMWLRTSDPVLMHDLRIRSASNPVFTKPKGENISVRDPNWVRRVFVDPHPAGNVIIREQKTYNGQTYTTRRLYLSARLTDNPDKAFQESYMRRLVKRPKHIQRALIEADWYVTPGGYFEKVWDPDIHVVDPFEVPLDWPRWRAMDWGYKTMGVVLWFAMDPDGNIYCIRELTFSEMTVSQVCEQIERIETAMGMWYAGRSMLSGVADTQIWEKRGDDGITKVEAFRRKGIVWQYATKERIDNAQAISSRLADHRNRATLPGLMIFRSCMRTIQYFPNILAEPDNPEMPMKGGMDHHFETMGYGVRYGERGASAIPHHDAARAAIDDRDYDDSAERGSDGYGGY